MSRAAKAGIASAVVVVLVAVAALAGEVIARRLVANDITNRVVTALELDDDHPVDVSLGGVVLLQVISGTLTDVHASSEDVVWQSISGDVAAQLHGLPTRGGDVSELGGAAEVSLDADDLQRLVAQAPVVGDALGDIEVSLDEDRVTATGGVSLLGAEVPVSATLTPGIEDDGSVVLAPRSVSIGGVEVTDDDIAQLPIGSDLLSSPLTVCEADLIPAGIAVTSVRTTPEQVAIRLSLDDGFLDLFDPDAAICF